MSVTLQLTITVDTDAHGAPTVTVTSPPVVESPAAKVEAPATAGDTTPKPPAKRRGRPPKAKPAEPAESEQAQPEPEAQPPAERADRRQVMAINKWWAQNRGTDQGNRAEGIALALGLDQPTDSGDLTPDQAARLLALWVGGDGSDESEASA